MVHFQTRLSEIIQDGIEAEGHDYAPDPQKGHFRASALPYCSRKLVFQYFLGWDYPEDSPIIIARNVGIAIHKFFQGLLESEQVRIEEKVEMDIDGIKLMGHADLIILDLEKYYILLDIKTTDQLGAVITKGPKEHHVAQLVIYLAAIEKKLECEKKDDKPLWGVLWYLDRLSSVLELLNSEKWQFFDVELDEENQEMFSALVEKGRRVQATLTEGLLPEKDAQSWECKNRAATCPYYQFCYETYFERVEDLDPFLKINP
ncbi:MAG: PD-(D/E)XK nuclease family protein [Promethearchaeota archaeon]